MQYSAEILKTPRNPPRRRLAKPAKHREFIQNTAQIHIKMTKYRELQSLTLLQGDALQRYLI